jgi:hypothetical protein
MNAFKVTPALLTTTSIWPSRRVASSPAATIEAGSVTSSGTQ